MNIKHSSKSAEHYTPPEYAEAFRQIMGCIAFDPASSELANSIIQADSILCEGSNALDIPWTATTVYCNPPGGKSGIRSNQSIWFEKMYTEWKAGSFKEGIFMAFNNSILRTNQESFTKLSFCIPSQRIRFWNSKSDLILQSKVNKSFNAKDHINKCIRSLDLVFYGGEYLFPSPSPSHDNVIIYFHPKDNPAKKWIFHSHMIKFGGVRI